MNDHDIRAASLLAARRAKELGLTQQEISKAIHADQSQVSRVLSGKSKRRSRVFIEVCNYVNRSKPSIGSELVKENDELISAIASVWDGSTSHASALATVIRSLSALHTNSKSVGAA